MMLPGSTGFDSFSASDAPGYDNNRSLEKGAGEPTQES
jgi:hypothetical protein